MIRSTAITIALLMSPALFAQTYIVPNGDCGAVTLRVNSDEPITANRIADAYVYLPTQRLAAELSGASGQITFTAHIPEVTKRKDGVVDGVVMAAVNFKPEMHGDETRTAHAKALIFCGSTTPGADWVRSAGLGLEIFPQEWNGPRPRMKAGDTMRFIAVDNASKQMIPDLPMELYRVGGARVAEGVPAKLGGMTFQYPEPGHYMVVATYRRPDPQHPEHWLVDTSTLTFDVK